MYGSKVHINQEESRNGHFLVLLWRCCDEWYSHQHGFFFVSWCFLLFPSGFQYLKLLKLFSLGIKPSSC